MNPVHVGAPFKLGVEFRDWWADVSFKNLDTVLTEIESALAASGYISGLIKAYQVAGWTNPYIVIEGYSGREYSSELHLRDAVLSVVSKIYPSIDYATVQFQVETYDNATGASNTVFQPSPIAAAGGSIGISSAFDSIGRDIGAPFGVDGTTGLLIGAAGVLLVIVLLKRA